MKKLCVTGSLHLDVIVEAPHLPRIDETVNGLKVDYIFGGKGGNQALAADQHGATVYLIGRIGADAFGKKIESTLKKTSIDINQLQKDQGASGMSVAIVDSKGDYGAVIVSAANSKIDEKFFSISENTGILLLQNEVPEHVNLATSRDARRKDVEVWLNAAPERKLSKELLSLVDVLIVNRVESQAYANILKEKETKHITKILTFGADGLEIHFPTGQKESLPSYQVKAVSSHGAGDVFVGALAARRLAGDKFEAALNYAQAASALHVSSNLQIRRELNAAAVFAFLDSNKRKGITSN